MKNFRKKIKERRQRNDAIKYSGYRTMSDSLEREFIRAYFRW